MMSGSVAGTGFTEEVGVAVWPGTAGVSGVAAVTGGAEADVPEAGGVAAVFCTGALLQAQVTSRMPAMMQVFLKATSIGLEMEQMARFARR
jgi:hypothetical protein